jgi:hypothetical protein
VVVVDNLDNSSEESLRRVKELAGCGRRILSVLSLHVKGIAV